MCLGYWDDVIVELDDVIVFNFGELKFLFFFVEVYLGKWK